MEALGVRARRLRSGLCRVSAAPGRCLALALVLLVAAQIGGCFQVSRQGLIVGSGDTASGLDTGTDSEITRDQQGEVVADLLPPDSGSPDLGVDLGSADARPDTHDVADSVDADLRDLSDADGSDSSDADVPEVSPCSCGFCADDELPSSLVGDWGYWQPMDASDVLLMRRFRSSGSLDSEIAIFPIGPSEAELRRSRGRYAAHWIEGPIAAYSAPGVRFEERSPSGELAVHERPYQIFVPQSSELDFTPPTGYQTGPERVSFDVLHNLPVDSIRYARVTRRYHRPPSCPAGDLPLLEESQVEYIFESLPGRVDLGQLRLRYLVSWRPDPQSPMQTKKGVLLLSFKLTPLPATAALIELIDVWKAIDEAKFWDCTGGYSVCDVTYGEISTSRFYVSENGGFLIPLGKPLWHRIPFTPNDLAVPAGPFVMGSEEGFGRKDEHPQHKVTLAEFRIDRTEVSIGAYKACVDAGFCTYPELDLGGFFQKSYQDPGLATFPIQFVSWRQALGFCLWSGKRLPTEAEWEKAARGSDGRRYPWGNDDDPTRYVNQPGQLVPVESFPDGKSPYGALNMLGNAPEWVLDWYDPSYYTSSPPSDPQGPPSAPAGQIENRVIRGYWVTPGPPYLARRMSYHELQIFSSIAPYGVGFRCAR